VSIRYTPTRKLPTTFGLSGQLQQLFINLLLNAYDAMPDGGELTIRVQRRVRKIVASVEDTGCGIAAEVGRRVFEPFFTTKEPGQGAGLGLAVCYNVVEKHGGRIDFDSTPAIGTTFTVEIPILTEPPTEDAPAIRQGEASAPRETGLSHD